MFQQITLLNFKQFIFGSKFQIPINQQINQQILFMKIEQDYKILPKRNGKTDGSFKKMQPISFYTNYYTIDIDSRRSKIYQYSFSLPEEIPHDSQIYDRAVYSIKKVLRQKIGYLAHSGQMIWGQKLLKVPTTLQCIFQFQEVKYSFECVIKMTKELDLRDLNQEKFRNIYLQILNINLKNMFNSIGLSQPGKNGQYFSSFDYQAPELFQLRKKGLKVLKGFRFTLTCLNSGIYLQIDVCSKVLQDRNLLQIFNGKPIDYNRQIFIGSTVITNYGRCKSYQIQDIDYSKTPLSTFYYEKNKKETTFIEYYKDVYGLKISNTKQPLLKVIKNVKKQFTKGGKELKLIPQIVYLVPQYVSPTGMTDDQRADFDTMKLLAPHTKLSPNQRANKCQNVIDALNDVQGIVQIKNPKKLEGYILQKPDLQYNGGTIIQPDNRGNIRHRGVLNQAFFFQDWIFAYSIGKKEAYDHDEANNAVGLLCKSGKTYGVQFKNPGFIVIDSGNIQDWKQQLRKDVQRNKKPQIIVLFLAPFQEKFYGQLKRFLTNEIKCPSQFIKRKTLNNPKGAMSAASKIIIQMNIKVGCVPWKVEKTSQYFSKKSVMYGALSISKGSKGYTLAFVGTINSDCTRVFSDCKVGVKSKQSISVDMLEEIFVNWARNYFMNNNKTVPNLIILYRQGLSIPQIKMQLPKMQIPALQRMIKIIGKKTQTKNYNPQIVIVTVNKKINTRYFLTEGDSRQRQKFIPNLINPDSGSIMVESLSVDDMYDFHLAAQYVTQGTCTPTLFRVAYDTSQMPHEALINFTFEQCFNYYNWEGAVRVPACLQCADKLSKLGSQYIKEDVVQSDLSKKHYFL